MRSLLRHAFALGVGLHTDAGMRRAVEAAGLDWAEAKKVIELPLRPRTRVPTSSSYS